MSDRIDLENAILMVRQVEEHIGLLLRTSRERLTPFTEDETAMHLAAIKVSLQLRLDDLWETFLQVFELDDYASDETKQLRDAVLKEAQEDAAWPFPIPDEA